MRKLKSIVGPKFGDILCQMLKSGSITPDDVPPLVENYVYFEINRETINTLYSGKWVASDDESLTISTSLKELEQVLDGLPKPNCDYAYIEQIP